MNGSEVHRVIEKNKSNNSAEELEAELKDVRNEEVWKIGEIIRKFR